MSVEARALAPRGVAQGEPGDRAPGTPPRAGRPEAGGGARDASRLRLAPRPAPTARLGLAWAVALLAASTLGPVATVVVVAPVAAVAAASTQRRVGAAIDHRSGASAAGAVVVALAALGGYGPAAVALCLATAATGIAAGPAARPAAAGPTASGTSIGASVAAFALPAAAAASLVVASAAPGVLGCALASALCLWDLAAWTVGNGPAGGLSGLLAGSASLGVLSVLFAAIADPPLSGSRPWILFALLVVAAPLGVAAARRLAAGRRLPALRRLDSAALAGPAWVAASAMLLHH